MTFDSNRSIDENGYLTILNCVITGEDVADYWGREVPDYQNHRLPPDAKFPVYRPLEELKDADFSGMPLLSQHVDYSAAENKHKYLAGTILDPLVKDGEIKGTVKLWHQNDIDNLDQGKRFLSAGYMYTPILEDGMHNGKPYKIRMTNIRANHVALVDNPRYKPAIVADEQIKEITEREPIVMTQNSTKTLTLDEAFAELKKIAKDEKMSEEEKETEAEKVKEKVKDKAKDSEKKPDACDEDDEDDEDKKKDKKKTEDKAKDSKTAMDFDSMIEKKAQALIDAALKKHDEKKMALDSALVEYERVCGRVNRMAFDSADTVLDTILKNKNHSPTGKTLAQKQAMVEVLPGIQKFNTQTRIAMDSKTSSNTHVTAGIASYFERRN